MLFAVQRIMGMECATKTGLLRTMYELAGGAKAESTGPLTMRAYISDKDQHNQLDWTHILSSLHPHLVRFARPPWLIATRYSR